MNKLREGELFFQVMREVPNKLIGQPASYQVVASVKSLDDAAAFLMGNGITDYLLCCVCVLQKKEGIGIDTSPLPQ